ncbi:MAG: ribosomal protein S18-alanine N-acetyltransferase [Vicinamibacteria bacterium]
MIAAFGPARDDDIPSLVAIDATSPRPWSHDDFAAELQHVAPTLLVLRVQDEVAAFVVARIQPPEMDIVNVAVAERSRRRGFGRAILLSLFDEVAVAGVTSVFLEVRESNREARALYEGLGFKETQRRCRFYKDPDEDAVLMRRPIAPKSRAEK